MSESPQGTSGTPPFRCSDAARERCDPIGGTAAPARRWLLIEHPGPWQIDALAGSGIEPGIRQALQRAAQERAARILLIRRPGRRINSTTRSWAVLSYDKTAIWGQWRSDQDLLASVDALMAPEPMAQEPGTGDPSGQLLLVCTHGLHDLCCAVRGRPVALALQREWPDRTWECSHVGGDRFAANLVVLPDGLYYGQVEPESAVEVVRSHLNGKVRSAQLRGFSVFPPVAQAAVAAVHAEFGPAGARDVTAAALQQSADGNWQVDIRARGPLPALLRARVVTSSRSAAQLTCRARSQFTATDYQVVDLAALESAPPTSE